MKGLLVKDVCILKMQKNVLLILLAMCVVFTVFLESPTYIVSLQNLRHRLVIMWQISLKVTWLCRKFFIMDTEDLEILLAVICRVLTGN